MDLSDLIHDVSAYRRPRAWAAAHGHAQPDDRMLVAYCEMVAEAAYRAGREETAAEIAAALKRGDYAVCNLDEAGRSINLGRSTGGVGDNPEEQRP